MLYCGHGFLAITCPTCKRAGQAAPRPFGQPERDEPEAIDLGKVITEASDRVARSAQQERALGR